MVSQKSSLIEVFVSMSEILESLTAHYSALAFLLCHSMSPAAIKRDQEWSKSDKNPRAKSSKVRYKTKNSLWKINQEFNQLGIHSSKDRGSNQDAVGPHEKHQENTNTDSQHRPTIVSSAQWWVASWLLWGPFTKLKPNGPTARIVAPNWPCSFNLPSTSIK